MDDGGPVISLFMRVGSLYPTREPKPLKKPCTRLSARLVAVLAGLQAALPLIATAAAGAADSTWLDMESRIQYGYYTEDARTLAALTSQLTSGDSADEMKSYYAALASYRLTLLQSSKDKAGARDSAERCVASLDRALEARKDFADALALQSACFVQLSELSTLRAPLAGVRGTSQIAKALALAPRNPRVLLLDAMDDYERASNGVDKDRAVGKLKKAIAALEGERQDIAHIPGWGLADAYTYMGRVYLERGDSVAARDALEHALLAAPDFGEARRLMTKITSG